MAPIRVGIIGLASKDSPQFANGEWGVKHFKALQHLPAYEVVAVCNSTLESSTRSIAFHKLDPSVVRAYGSPKDLAADPNVDLVVVTVSAKYHLDLAKPAIEGGKDVYVEFPLAPSVAEAEELYELAKKKGVKTIAGTQAVSEPVMVKLRELIPEIGEVVNTVMVGASPLDVSMGWPEDAAGLLELNHEVSRIVIVLGHLLGGFSSVVGEFEDLQAVYKTQVKTTTLLDATYQPAKPNHPITSPDNMIIQGVLKSGAIASINIRTTTTLVDNTGFRWIISGTQGEIELVTNPGFFQTGLDGATIKLKKKGEEEAKVIDWQSAEPANVSAIQGMEKSIVRAYAAFAEGRTQDYATFGSALAIHRALEKATKNALWARK